MSIFLIFASMKQARSYIHEQLQGLYPPVEIQSLSYWALEAACHESRQSLLRNKDKQISAKQRETVERIVGELRRNRPIQYIVGETTFYGLPITVNEHVLIPRPETEEVVERVLQWAPKHERITVLDMGTGSGCIAIALAKHLPLARVDGLDSSSQALAVARENAKRNQVDISFFEQDILCMDRLNQPTKYDIIVSNPPYIVPSEQAAMSANVLDYEPHQALFVPENQPLLFYERIADWAQTGLKANGLLCFETSALFGQATAEMLRQKGFEQVTLSHDLSGKDRILTATRKPLPV
jgi:release factor glutamine methyltransferase